MKKFSILLAALAILLAGCSKDDVSDETSQEPIAFKAGQEVTITASATDLNNPETRVSGTISGSTLSFTWDSGDALTVTVGDKSTTFTMDSGAGTSEATFKGTMPSDGTTFDASYGPTSVPTTQTYAGADKIPASSMYFKATGCTLNGNLTLKPQFSVLKLNLYGTGTKTKKIIVKQEGGGAYTLNCGDGVTLGTSDAPTPFYIVVPTGTYKLTAEFYDDSATPELITSFTTTGAQTFSTDKFLTMPEKEVKVHEYVDLGLTVKWATCNVGASKPEDYGDYFAWGETTGYNSGKMNFSWSTYKWCNGSSTTMSKYCIQSSYGTVDNKTILESADDAAIVNWGGDWRMPTKVELEELIGNCTWTWTQENGVYGYRVTSNKVGYTDKSIFLPTAGCRSGAVLDIAGSYGRYWSISLNTDNGSCAWFLDFNSSSIYMHGTDRYFGLSVRPVKVEKKEHEYVDLGLSVKWATCNVGADKPEDYGDYFAWGETTGYDGGKTDFNWSTYKLCNGSSTTMTKYCTNSTYGTVDDKTVLDPADDAATANWGGVWRMPTYAELQELLDNCTWLWTQVNGVNGYMVTSNKTGYTDKSIFLPAAGHRWGGYLDYDPGSLGYYWSSSLIAGYCFDAWHLYFLSGSRRMDYYRRYRGRSVRAVCP